MSIQALREMISDRVEEAQGLQAKTDFGPADQRRFDNLLSCLLYTSPSPRDRTRSRMPSSA